MKLITTWLNNRRLKREAEAKLQAEKEAKEEQELVDKLRAVMKETQNDALVKAGFIPINRTCHTKGSHSATSYAVGPDKKLYRIRVFSGGGVEIEKAD